MTDQRAIPRLLVALAVLLTAAIAIEMQRDRVYAASATPTDAMLYINSGTVMKKLAMSYDSVLADVYWMRALQHFGSERLRPESTPGRYGLLYPLLDLTTSLDPRFTTAYRFGAIFLAEPLPGGAGRPDLAIELLENGVRAMPDKWEFCHDIGFVYYWHLHDYTNAAKWFERGGALPNSPWWLKTYAAVMLTRGGDREASRLMWQTMLQTSEDKFLQESSRKHLAQLDALDQVDVLQRIVAEFERRRGHLPRRWEDLVAAGLLRGVPLDPAGTPYDLAPETAQVEVARSSLLQPMPTDAVMGQPPVLHQ